MTSDPYNAVKVDVGWYIDEHVAEEAVSPVPEGYYGELPSVISPEQPPKEIFLA